MTTTIHDTATNLRDARPAWTDADTRELGPSTVPIQTTADAHLSWSELAVGTLTNISLRMIADDEPEAAARVLDDLQDPENIVAVADLFADFGRPGMTWPEWMEWARSGSPVSFPGRKPSESIPYAGANWRVVELEIGGLASSYRIEWHSDSAPDDAWAVHVQLQVTDWNPREKRAQAIAFATARQGEINARRDRGPIRYRADGSFVNEDEPRPSFDFSPTISPEAEAEFVGYGLGVEGVAMVAPPNHFGPSEIEGFSRGLAAGRQTFEEEELASRADLEGGIPHDPLAFVDHAELVEFAGHDFAAKVGEPK